MAHVKAALGAIVAAAGDLASVDSALGEAIAAAAAPTISVATAGADDVSLAVSQAFEAYGLDFSCFAEQLRAYQQAFIDLVNSGAAAYADAETSAKSLLGSSVSVSYDYDDYWTKPAPLFGG